MKIRSFISLDLPLSLRHELSGHAKLIAGQDKRQKIRWLPPENYHLTLAFLGNIDYDILRSLHIALERKLQSTKAVPFKFSEITPFPFSRSPKIAAALLERTEELMQLQLNVANCVRGCGISLERRRFAPHVTLGRLKSRSGKRFEFQPVKIFLEGVADSVILFQSELAPQGAIHTALGVISLTALPGN